MPDASFACMDDCKLARLSVAFGGFPDPDEKLSITMDVSIKKGERVDDSHATMRIDLLLYGDGGKFYKIDAQAIGRFSIPVSWDDGQMDEYLKRSGANEMYSTIRTMLDTVTSCFPAGPLNAPPADIALI